MLESYSPQGKHLSAMSVKENSISEIFIGIKVRSKSVQKGEQYVLIKFNCSSIKHFQDT